MNNVNLQIRNDVLRYDSERNYVVDTLLLRRLSEREQRHIVGEMLKDKHVRQALFAAVGDDIYLLTLISEVAVRTAYADTIAKHVAKVTTHLSSFVIQ